MCCALKALVQCCWGDASDPGGLQGNIAWGIVHLIFNISFVYIDPETNLKVRQIESCTSLG